MQEANLTASNNVESIKLGGMALGADPILILSEPTGSDLLPGLPIASNNIFQRIIRNPRPESPHARERECTEMLAAVLLNAPALRHHLFRWMAKKSGSAPDLIDDLQFEIGTERFIGAKRDDLRIEGRRDRDADCPAELLWTVEVKVGSSFHTSPAQRLDEGGDEGTAEVDEELVNQLKHYDDWLCRQRATHCAGFVLALHNLTDSVRLLGLKRRWTCLSWTWLGLEVKAALESGDLPPQDELLSRHLLGFITTNLWRPDQMPDSNPKLDFNDIALIRAFAKIGKECEKKVNELIAGVVPVAEELGVGVGPVTTYQKLYKAKCLSGVGRFLVPGCSKDSDPSLEMSIGFNDEPYGDYFGLWVLMSPKHERFGTVRRAVEAALKKMRSRNQKWNGGTGEAEDWAILELSAPLTDLLSAEDQQKKLVDFMRAALTDLKETGAIDTIVAAVAGPNAAGLKK